MALAKQTEIEQSDQADEEMMLIKSDAKYLLKENLEESDVSMSDDELSVEE